MCGDHQALATFTISVKREVETPIALLLPHETTARVSEEACQAGNGKQYVSSDGYLTAYRGKHRGIQQGGNKKAQHLANDSAGLIVLGLSQVTQ